MGALPRSRVLQGKAASSEKIQRKESYRNSQHLKKESLEAMARGWMRLEREYPLTLVINHHLPGRARIGHQRTTVKGVTISLQLAHQILLWVAGRHPVLRINSTLDKHLSATDCHQRARIIMDLVRIYPNMDPQGMELGTPTGHVYPLAGHIEGAHLNSREIVGRAGLVWARLTIIIQLVIQEEGQQTLTSQGRILVSLKAVSTMAINLVLDYTLSLEV